MRDELFEQAGLLIIDKDNASIGLMQRQFRIRFNRAARIMDELCDAGVVGQPEGTKSRNILMTRDQFINYVKNYTSADEPEQENNNSEADRIQLDLDQMKAQHDKSIYDAKLHWTPWTDSEKISGIDNILYVHTKPEQRNSIIQTLFDEAKACSAKIILIGINELELLGFADRNELLIPIIHDTQKGRSVLGWAVAEMNDRVKRILNLPPARSFSSYNSVVNQRNADAPVEQRILNMPRIMIIIDGVKPLLEDVDSRAILMNLMLQGRTSGIHLVMLSSFSQRNLPLKELADLVTISSEGGD